MIFSELQDHPTLDQNTPETFHAPVAAWTQTDWLDLYAVLGGSGDNESVQDAAEIAMNSSHWPSF